jgi:hypothetical protein
VKHLWWVVSSANVTNNISGRGASAITQLAPVMATCTLHVQPLQLLSGVLQLVTSPVMAIRRLALLLQWANSSACAQPTSWDHNLQLHRLLHTASYCRACFSAGTIAVQTSRSQTQAKPL